MSQHTPDDTDAPEPHDEAAWMATAIEVLAIVGAVVFAVVQAR